MRFHDREAEASDFTEKTFYGPIWKQVKDALDYIKTNMIVESGLEQIRNVCGIKLRRVKRLQGLEEFMYGMQHFRQL